MEVPTDRKAAELPPLVPSGDARVPVASASDPCRVSAWALPLLVLGLGALYFRGFYRYGIHLLDEGYLVAGAMRALSGELPYLDFQSNYGPGRYLFVAALFSLFDADVLVTRAASVTMLSVAGTFVFVSLRRTVGTPWALLGAAIVLITRPPWHKTFFVVFQIVCATVFAAYFTGPTRRKATLSGLATGLTALFRHDLAGYAVVAFSSVLVLSQSRGRNARILVAHLSSYAGAAILVVMPLVLAYVARGPLQSALDQYLFSGFRDVSASSLPFPPLLPLSAASVIAAVFYLPLPIYGIALTVVSARARWGALLPNESRLLMLTVFGSLIYLQLAVRTDLLHVWQVLPIATLLTFFLLGDAQRFWRPWARRGYILWTLTFAALAVGVYLSSANPLAPPTSADKASFVPLGLPRATVMVRPPNRDRIHGVHRLVMEHTEPTDAIFAAPDIPMFYFLCNRRNALTYDLLRPGIADDRDLQQQVVATLARDPPALVILNTRDVSDRRPERRFRNRAPLIYEHLMTEYEPLAELGGLVVMKRKGEHRAAAAAPEV